MTTPPNIATDADARVETVVDLPAAEAFRFFTEDIGAWWNPDHHLLGPDITSMTFEPRVGGHIYDTYSDGRECRWARVLAFEPPARVVFSWDIGLDWQVETDPAKTSEVEVTFTPDGPNRTHVQLVHRNLDRHGEGWEAMRDAVRSGWNLDRYVATATA